MAPLITSPGIGSTEPPVIATPDVGGSNAQVIAPPGAHGATAQVIPPPCSGMPESPMVTDVAGYLLQRMVLDTG